MNPTQRAAFRTRNSKLETRNFVSSILTWMIMLCIVPSLAGRTPRFLGHKEFLPYTRHLPAVYKIELLKLQLKDERWHGEIAATKVLQGAEAQTVAALWRRQTYTGSLAACHEPAYAIKFYSRRKLIAYASVCWSCNSMYFITPNLHQTQSFLGGNKKGEQLSEIFRLAFTEGNEEVREGTALCGALGARILLSLGRGRVRLRSMRVRSIAPDHKPKIIISPRRGRQRKMFPAWSVCWCVPKEVF